MIKSYSDPFIKLLVIIFALSIVSCSPGKKKKKEQRDPYASKAGIFVPTFNKDSAYHYVQKQVDFGPRVPGTEAHAECAKYLIETIKRFTPNVIVQKFKTKIYTYEIFDGKNIIASFNPDKKERILLCAHWDTRPFADHDPDPAKRDQPIDGANDGASGCGVLLEIARQLKMHPPEVGIDIIFFDLEDYGQPRGTQLSQEDTWALGSQYWSKTPHKIGYRAKFGLLLDMVGGYDAQFPREGTSELYAPHLFDKVWGIARKIGYGAYFVDDKTPSILDDHYYINEIARIPTIDIIQYEPTSYSGFFKHWHTTKDNMDFIDIETLDVVGQVVLTVVYWE